MGIVVATLGPGSGVVVATGSMLLAVFTKPMLNGDLESAFRKCFPNVYFESAFQTCIPKVLSKP